MTRQNTNDERRALLRLADELVDDILAASDEEVLADFKEVYGDPVAFANKMRGKIDLLAIEGNKKVLLAARRALDSEGRAKVESKKVDIAIARKALGKLLSGNLGPMPLTLAARKEKVNEMSDDDVLGMVDDLEALGFVLRIKNGS